ncbi:MAG TPA: hypothetical protein VK589_21290 [Chryseolinea sp.]|nr:hypothetical protein [Chryseolinea sp.]
MKTISPFKILPLFLGALIAFMAGFNPAVGAGSVYLLTKAINNYSKVPNGVSFITAADVSALAAFPGEYEQKLFSTLINSMDIAKDITVIPNVKKKLNLTKLRVKKGARPYSGSHEPDTGDLIYTPRVLEVKVGKRDLLIDPEDYRSTWMASQVGAGSGASKKTIPFEQYVWSEVMKALGAEINDETAYFGLDLSALTVVPFDAGDTYTAGEFITFGSPTKWYKCVTNTSAAESPTTHPAKWSDVTAIVISKGLGTIIAEEIVATTLSVTATGAITDGATAKTAFKKIFRAQSAAYKKAGVIVYCSYTDYEFLLDGLSENTKYIKEDASPSGNLFLPETGRKCEVVPATWMNGSRRLICTPKENLIMGTDLLSDMNDISVIEDVYTLKTGIKFVIGWQIRDLAALKVGDQA